VEEEAMSVNVYIPTPYREFTGGSATVDVEAEDVGGLLAALAATYPGLGDRVLAADGGLPGHLSVYVNEVEVRSLDGLATRLSPGDKVALIPAMAGGAGAALTGTQMSRYQRQIILPEVGVEGQRRLLASRVLLIGAGGLGSPAAIYLAAAGVGTIGVVDGDRVDETNLHRQVLHMTHDVGRPKTQSARRHLEDLNPDVTVVEHRTFLSSENALEILKDYDVIVNGSDNFPTRYLVNDAAVLLGKPLVDASILRFEGQATVFLPGQGCYRCLFPEPPAPGTVPSCAEGGILGALAGVMGTIQAVETLKILLGRGETLAGRLLLYDALAAEWRTFRWRRNPDCPVCGDHPTIHALIDYEAFCGVRAPGEARTEDAGPSLELQPREALRLLAEGAALVDVRPEAQYAAGHIPGSLALPLEELSARVGEIPSGRKIVCVCNIGVRSALAVEYLRGQGAEAYNLAGGVLAWQNEGLPWERT
jgi:molybdopterin/thiamine biosynthesis adenylyltransferase/rhodanese-related sulfurtransferase/molybdopterin converting factor small subunit